jgi:hypothetical protein
MFMSVFGHIALARWQPVKFIASNFSIQTTATAYKKIAVGRADDKVCRCARVKLNATFTRSKIPSSSKHTPRQSCSKRSLQLPQSVLSEIEILLGCFEKTSGSYFQKLVAIDLPPLRVHVYTCVRVQVGV